MLRCLVLVVVLGGCFGTLDANLHPAVIPKLSALPDERRAQQLDAANARPDPEQRTRDLSPKARKLELAAAVAAAIIGDALSYSHDVTIGFGGQFDETGEIQQPKAAHGTEPARLVPDGEGAEAVPWIPVAPAQ